MGLFNFKQALRSASVKVGVMVAGTFLAVSAFATPIFDISGSLTAADPTQLGRLSRNGVPSDFSAPSLFPGVINTGTTYNYRTYTLNVQEATFIQINVDSLSANTFVSAYMNAYMPSSTGPNFGLDLNYLGDAGTSGNSFGTNPLFFQVVVPAFTQLVLVINETSGTGLGLLNPFRIIVEGFLDADFTDAPARVPEPSSVALLLSAMLGFGAVRAAKRKKSRDNA